MPKIKNAAFGVAQAAGLFMILGAIPRILDGIPYRQVRFDAVFVLLIGVVAVVTISVKGLSDFLLVRKAEMSIVFVNMLLVVISMLGGNLIGLMLFLGCYGSLLALLRLMTGSEVMFPLTVPIAAAIEIALMYLLQRIPKLRKVKVLSIILSIALYIALNMLILQLWSDGLNFITIYL